MAFEFKECGIKGLFEILPQIYGDGRGSFFESYNEKDFFAAGITERFAHGFFVLSDEAVSSYKCSDFYYPEDEDGLMWNDPTINVDWFGAAQVAGQSVEPILSEKDKKHPTFDPQKKYFNFDASAWLGD